MGYAVRMDGQGWRAVDGPADVAGDETYAEAPPVPTLAQRRAEALVRIKAQRQQALDSLVRSAGVAEIYAENLLAAQRYAASDTSPMRSGQTPTQYLTAMAGRMGLSVGDFAAYVLQENGSAARKAVAVEEAYLDFAYSRLPVTAEAGLDSLLADCAAAIAAALAVT